ncbi:MAG: winged helix-turn-helix transcriptional regulator [Bacteroidales bacterium]|nr:winged helix-turn-helix transcriptional regulator [Bacteroidales bacterium]
MIKKEKFSGQDQELAGIAKVLSHPARIAILRFLASTNTCISGDISNIIPLSRTTVSQHLQALKNIGLIKGEIDGVKVNYCINNERIIEIQETLNIFFNCTVNQANNCCKP